MTNPLRRLIVALVVSALGIPLSAAPTADGKLVPAELRLDLVHNNPGEEPFVTRYNDPKVLRELGYTGKVFELFQAAQFGVDWSDFDPGVYPAGSPERAWVDAKAAELDGLYNATRAAGLAVYCHTDMIVLPKRLVERRGMQQTFKNVNAPETQEVLRALIRQMFARFPQLDGLVVRIGETYLNGAPYHTGGIDGKKDPRTIIPLINLLRDEICVKLNKKLLFRTWVSFDVDLATYLAVNDGVEPHPNLSFVVKQCEGDFHRGNPFSKVFGVGRHPQIVEAQCQREYEGKGAYPNYIAHGTIEGFEEHRSFPIKSIRQLWSNPLVRGIHTWSRGGGWYGPYLTNELWCDLNVYVLANWARDPNRSEAEIFDQFCRDVLKLDAANAALFRRLALLSADAVYRGKRSTHNDIDPIWSRDIFIGVPPLPADPAARRRVIDQKDEAVALWTEIVRLADALKIPDAANAEYVRVSSRYGLHLYRIYQAGFHLAELGAQGDRAALDRWIAVYDQGWRDLRDLKANHPSCATLYDDVAWRRRPGIGDFVNSLRRQPASGASSAQP